MCDPEKVEDLGYGVTAITIESNTLIDPFEYELAPYTLYERSWYEDLLTSMYARQQLSIALIGSAGTSKSTWQFWYLYRVLQAIHHSKFRNKIKQNNVYQ